MTLNTIDPSTFSGPRVIGYVSGGWSSINGAPFNHIAKWVGGAFGDSCSLPLAIHTPISLSNQTALYPNPATNTLFIQIPDVQSACIYDMQGRLVIETKTYLASKGLDVRSLSPGMYLLGTEAKDGQHMLRFIKH